MTFERLASRLVSLLVLCPASTADAVAARRHLTVAYETPTSCGHAVVCAMLRRRQALEQIGEFISPLRLPHPSVLGVTC